MSVGTSSTSAHDSCLLGSAEGSSGEKQLDVRIGENVEVLQGDNQRGTRSVPIGEPEDHASLEKKKEVF